MRIDGACHCGAIEYRAELDPEKVGICHCTDCQALSASAFRSLALVAEVDFKLLKGAPSTYVKTGDSGAPRLQVFCDTCGSGLYATSAGEGPRIFNVRLGTVRQRQALPPRFECWRRSRLPWLPELENTTKFDTAPRL